VTTEMAFLCGGLCGFVAAMLLAMRIWNRHHDDMMLKLDLILEGLENIVEPKD